MGTTDRLIAGVIFALVFGACRSSSLNSPSHPPPQKIEADQSMERMRVQSYGPTGLDWELSAPQAEGYAEDGRTVVRDLQVDLYENQQRSTTVTADEGVMFGGGQKSELVLSSFSVVLNPGDMFLNGNVVMVSTEGNRITTDWAHFKKKEEIIVSTAPVTVVREDSVTHGVGLEATTDLSKIKIFNQTLIIPASKLKSNESF